MTTRSVLLLGFMTALVMSSKPTVIGIRYGPMRVQCKFGGKVDNVGEMCVGGPNLLRSTLSPEINFLDTQETPEAHSPDGPVQNDTIVVPWDLTGPDCVVGFRGPLRTNVKLRWPRILEGAQALQASCSQQARKMSRLWLSGTVQLNLKSPLKLKMKRDSIDRIRHDGFGALTKPDGEDACDDRYAISSDPQFQADCIQAWRNLISGVSLTLEQKVVSSVVGKCFISGPLPGSDWLHQSVLSSYYAATVNPVRLETAIHENYEDFADAFQEFYEHARGFFTYCRGTRDVFTGGEISIDSGNSIRMTVDPFSDVESVPLEAFDWSIGTHHAELQRWLRLESLNDFAKKFVEHIVAQDQQARAEPQSPRQSRLHRFMQQLKKGFCIGSSCSRSAANPIELQEQ